MFILIHESSSWSVLLCMSYILLEPKSAPRVTALARACSSYGGGRSTRGQTPLCKHISTLVHICSHFVGQSNIWVSPRPRSREIHSTFCERSCSYIAKGVNSGKDWELRPKMQLVTASPTPHPAWMIQHLALNVEMSAFNYSQLGL